MIKAGDLWAWKVFEALLSFSFAGPFGLYWLGFGWAFQQAYFAGYQAKQDVITWFGIVITWNLGTAFLTQFFGKSVLNYGADYKAWIEAAVAAK